MAEFSTGKSVLVLATVVGCFAILWPKIFYPMMMTAMSLTSSLQDEVTCEFLLDSDVRSYPFFLKLCDCAIWRHSDLHPSLHKYQSKENIPSKRFFKKCQKTILRTCQIDIFEVFNILPASLVTVEDIQYVNIKRSKNLTICLNQYLEATLPSKPRKERAPQHPHMNLPPRMREAMAQARPSVQDAKIIDGRPLPHPSARNAPKLQPEKSSGAMGIVMPIYTIGIIGFFLYTILKLVCRKNPTNEVATEERPSFRGYQMDANLQNYTTIKDSNRKSKQTPSGNKQASSPCCEQGKTQKFLEDYGKENEEVFDDEKDLEIFQLRQKLIETEQRMENLLGQIEVQLTPCDTKHQESLLLKNPQHQVQMKDAQLEADLRKEMSEQAQCTQSKEDNEDGNDSSPDSEKYETVKEISECKEVNGDLGFDDSNSNSSQMDEDKGDDDLSEKEGKPEEKETELRQRVRDVFEEEDFTYRNRGVTYSDVLNF